MPEPISFERIRAVMGGGDAMLIELASRLLRPDATDDEIRAAVDRAGDDMDRAEYRRLWRCP